MANKTTHGLSSQRIRFFAIIHHRKNQRKDNMWWGTHACSFKVNWAFSTSHVILASTFELFGASTFFETFGAHDPRGVEIKLTIGPETSIKFPISKSTTLWSYWCMSSFKLNVSISTIFASNCGHFKIGSFYNNLTSKTIQIRVWQETFTIIQPTPMTKLERTQDFQLKKSFDSSTLTFIQLLQTTNNGKKNECKKE